MKRVSCIPRRCRYMYWREAEVSTGGPCWQKLVPARR